jgi:lysozyme family protein
MSGSYSFEKLKSEYAALWDEMTIPDAARAAISKSVRRMLKAKARHEKVASASSVPWHVIALVHMMEASLRFDRHLHNGDPLTARTVRKPAGRPPHGAPPFSWEDSAIDALGMKNLSAVSNWTVEQFAYQMERYNGFGYRTRAKPPIPSPYLWSFSNHYRKGKFIKDGVYDPNAVSKQIGAMPLLQELAAQANLTLPREQNEPSLKRKPEAAVAYPGKPLKLNSYNTVAIRAVQTALKQAGFDVAVSGQFDEATEAAVKLFQARSADLKGKDLAIDGVVGPKTWAALFNTPAIREPTVSQPPSKYLKEVINVARAEQGVSEDPPGSNRGPRVEEYQRAAGYSKPVPWCVCYLYWCFKVAAENQGVHNPFPRTGGVHDAWARARTAGFRTVTAAEATADPSLVVPGMVFFVDAGLSRDGSPIGHAGLVVARTGGEIRTLEGNTDDRGGRVGWRVLAKTKSIRRINMGLILIDR